MHHPEITQSETLIYMSEGHLKSGSTNKGSTDFYSYDATNDKWTKLANMPGPGVVAGASFYIGNNKVYSGIGITEPVESFHKEFYEYDISTNKWTAIADYPGSGVFGPVSFVIGNAGYVVTGQSSTGANMQDLYKLYDITSSVPDVNSMDGFSLYPNPAVSSFNLEGQTSSEKIHFSMLNVIGDELRSGDISTNGNNFSEKVDVRDIPSGMYFLKIENDKSIITKKVIVE